MCGGPSTTGASEDSLLHSVRIVCFVFIISELMVHTQSRISHQFNHSLADFKIKGWHIEEQGKQEAAYPSLYLFSHASLSCNSCTKITVMSHSDATTLMQSCSVYRSSLVLSFTGAPPAEFGETLGRWSK